MISAEQSTFIGASAILDSQLRALRDGPGSAILAQIGRACGARSPAQLRVAEQVLAHPRAMLNQPIVEIARSASPLARMTLHSRPDHGRRASPGAVQAGNRPANWRPRP